MRVELVQSVKALIEQKAHLSSSKGAFSHLTAFNLLYQFLSAFELELKCQVFWGFEPDSC